MCLNPVPPSGFKREGKGISSNCAPGIVNVEQTGCLIQAWKMSTLGLAENLKRKAMTRQFFCSPKSKARWFIIPKKFSFRNQQAKTPRALQQCTDSLASCTALAGIRSCGVQEEAAQQKKIISYPDSNFIPDYKWRKYHHEVHGPNWRKVWFTLVFLMENMKTMFQSNSTEDTRFVRNTLFRHYKMTS